MGRFNTSQRLPDVLPSDMTHHRDPNAASARLSSSMAGRLATAVEVARHQHLMHGTAGHVELPGKLIESPTLPIAWGWLAQQAP